MSRMSEMVQQPPVGSTPQGDSLSSVTSCSCQGTAEQQLVAAVTRLLTELRGPVVGARVSSMTIEEAAAQLNADPSWVGKLCKLGVIASIRRGKYVRIKQADLDDFEKRHRNARRVSHLNRV